MKSHDIEAISCDNECTIQMVNYAVNNRSPGCFDKLSFDDVIQFADFGHNLGFANQANYYLDDDHGARVPIGENDILGKSPIVANVNGNRSNKRKRARRIKSIEQVESQRMTHIAVERNRRKQMNEHLCILKSLMPSSYVQRGDQASIIGGAIEFVRELEELVKCLESQKRRRLCGDSPIGDHPNDHNYDSENGLPGETTTAEIKSCLGDVEVTVVGMDGVIKILSRTRPGQLSKTIAALEEDLQLTIVHTNITTIQQTVLYSFGFKMNGEALRLTAEDIANSTQQILSKLINASGSISFNNSVLEY